MIVYDDLRSCRTAMRQGSRSFSIAASLLPRDVRIAATALYAYCRAADDLVDRTADPAAAIVGLRDRLSAIYAGRPLGACERAFAGVVRVHELPRSLPEALLEGFAWDSEARRYETFAELRDYAMRVAGSVGVMMALVMGVRDADALGSAAELGCAMQFTNIARDVGEDARAGRLYLPLSALRATGVDPEAWRAAPRHDRAIASVVAALLTEADRSYARAEAGIRALPSGCRVAIRAASRLYRAIGVEVARNGFDAVTCRATVSGARKLSLVAGSLIAGRAGAIERIEEAAAILLPQDQARGIRNGSIAWVGQATKRSRSTLSCIASAGSPAITVSTVERV